MKALTTVLRKNGLLLFTARDAATLFPRRSHQTFNLQLHQWCAKGWVRRLKRGFYELAYPEPVPLPDFYVANKLYEPSYVSLETALSHYQILPEAAAQVTSVTPKPTRRFKNIHGVFTYVSFRPSAFTGCALIRMQGQIIRMAEPEKALVDWLYVSLRRAQSLNLKEHRLDTEHRRKMNKKKLAAYAALFGQSRKKLEEHLHALLR